MKIVKCIFKYLGIISIITLILIILMIIILKAVPRKTITANIEGSVEYLKGKGEIKLLVDKNMKSALHVYADEILLNIIYCMDGSKPLDSILLSKYYSEKNFPSLKKALQNESYGNQQYLRYWHGSTLIIRPLLIFFNIKQIYYIGAIILALLFTILVYKLFKAKMYIEILALVLANVITSSQFVPFCLEYFWTYMIMYIVSIIGFEFACKKDYSKKINILMFITGIMTCYFDFLTTETLTFSVPILLIFMKRNKNKEIENIWKEIKPILLWIILWLIGYASMWAMKWALSSIILNINALDYVVDNLLIRIKDKRLPLEFIDVVKLSLKTNINLIIPFKLFENNVTKASLICICIFIIAFHKRNKKELAKAFVVVALGVIPYARYIALAQHSFNHYFFTFRSQFITIMCIIIFLKLVIDKSQFNKEIKITRKNKK